MARPCSANRTLSWQAARTFARVRARWHPADSRKSAFRDDWPVHQVSVGGRSYLIVDPAAGRYDRQADNGGRRVTPVLELFRF